MSVGELLAQVGSEGRKNLTEVEAKQILRAAGVNVAETRLAKTKAEAVSIARELGFPIVLKVVSPQILHKSDIGGVKLNLLDADGVAAAYDAIMAAVAERQPEATVDGVAVQQMARVGIEVIVGVSKDEKFGPVLMFGLGGIFVEIMKDVSFRLVPITRRDARQMVKEIKGHPLLEGYRGQEPANIEMLEDILLKVSDLAEQHQEIKEMDLNPIFAYRDGAIVVDARIILE
ncbi:MAG: acetate--CoA ligase family protein [Dehalococcoidia bacterium]|nr:acetate--CoA ligase family protein [Dehalococcoidia bacterium]